MVNHLHQFNASFELINLPVSRLT